MTDQKNDAKLDGVICLYHGVLGAFLFLTPLLAFFSFAGLFVSGVGLGFSDRKLWLKGATKFMR